MGGSLSTKGCEGKPDGRLGVTEEFGNTMPVLNRRGCALSHDGTVWSPSDASAALGLSPAWLAHLANAAALPEADGGRNGIPTWRPETLRGWLRGQEAVAERMPLASSDLRAVALALAGISTVELAERTGYRAAAVRGRLARVAWALVLATPLETRLALLDSAPAVANVGRSPSTSRSTLVLGGPPSPGTGVPHRRLQRTVRLWDDGLTMEEIAAALGVSEGALLCALASEDAPPLPERWGVPRAASYLGWTDDNVRGHVRRGTFPVPDGRTGARQWWWPRTIESWAQANLPRRCPQCGARVAQLPQHLRRHS